MHQAVRGGLMHSLTQTASFNTDKKTDLSGSKSSTGTPPPHVIKKKKSPHNPAGARVYLCVHVCGGGGLLLLEAKGKNVICARSVNKGQIQIPAPPRGSAI